MKLNRTVVTKTKMDEDAGEAYVRAEKHELFSMIWEITKDAWAFVKENDAKRRLQRNVTAVIRRES